MVKNGVLTMSNRGEERLSWIDSELRQLQTLAGTTTTTTAALEPTEILQKQLEEAAKANLIAVGVCRVNRDLIGTPSRSLIVGTRGTTTAAAVTEGATITLANPAYTPATLTPVKFGAAVEITTEAINGFQFDLINDYINEAGYAMGKYLDSAVVAILMVPAASKGTVTATTSGVLSYDDIVGACGEIKADNWNPDYIVINPAQLVDLLKDTKFINASAYNSDVPIKNGEIGQICGCRVLVTNQQTAGSALVLDSKHAAMVAYKRDMTVKRDELPARDCIGLYVTQMATAAVLNQDATCLIASC
jgi:HK97 family phage major capsid protein